MQGVDPDILGKYSVYSEETAIEMAKACAKIYQTIHADYSNPIYKEKLNCDGLTICHNTDYGQEIKHFHIHFIPRYENDEIKYLSNKENNRDYYPK